ncbi:MAG: hypothetical protein CML44_00615 [Rhodobacteraceae bacterium]|jgi:hypothetical protein|nr:hypothetical protein [Paracoccaceae bacterium]|tara:strand:- start:9027 stop:9647 length:621 start_codon:yes stop_codon:yes gene_type:complete
MSGDQQILKMEGFLTIRDYNTGEVLQEAKNAINYENMSEAIADTLSSRGYGEIYQMAFGNGGASVDETGVITYLPPNTTGQNAALYNQTYAKIVDDTSVFNLDPTRNKMTVFHTTGRVYTDILVQCLLDYGEPAGQAAFDNSTQTDSNYIFDELGLLANYGTDANGNIITRLLTHVIFHPVQKSLNRQIQIDYTVRIQSLTNLVTI